MEAEKTVNQKIEVSDITTAFATQIVPMPVCRYEVLNGSPTSLPIQFAVIGQQVIYFLNKYFILLNNIFRYIINGHVIVKQLILFV